MAYSKPVQTPFVNAKPREFVVHLDSGEFVAVKANGHVAPQTGNCIIHAAARVVTADGSSLLDADGNPIASEYNCNFDAANLAAVGGISGFRKLMLLTVLGENPAWPNALDADVLAHANIRPNIASASVAGPVSGIGSLL